MSGARDEAREGDVGVSASQTLPSTSVCLRGGGPFSLEVGVEHACVCARARALAHGGARSGAAGEPASIGPGPGGTAVEGLLRD